MNGTYYVFAEYCPGDFYWGWWLYAAPMHNGHPVRTSSYWLRTWVYLHELALTLDMPQLSDTTTTNAEKAVTFLHTHPVGVMIEVTPGQPWTVLPADTLSEHARTMREEQLLEYKAQLKAAKEERPQ